MTKVRHEWLEFKYSEIGEVNDLSFITLRRSEISEIMCCIDDNNKPDKKWCRIYMKNGRDYLVYMPYEKVMEMI